MPKCPVPGRLCAAFPAAAEVLARRARRCVAASSCAMAYPIPRDPPETTAIGRISSDRRSAPCVPFFGHRSDASSAAAARMEIRAILMLVIFARKHYLYLPLYQERSSRIIDVRTLIFLPGNGSGCAVTPVHTTILVCSLQLLITSSVEESFNGVERGKIPVRG